MRRPRRMQTCGQHLDTATVRCASNDLLWYRLHVMYMVRLCYVYVHVMVCLVFAFGGVFVAEIIFLFKKF